MYNSFLKHIEKEKLLHKNDKILLAVSGGADSVVMTHLFSLSDFNFDIAHCNFKLRNKDSEKDEQFVKELAKKYKVKCFVKICNAYEYSIENNISIEMSARELRYKWFKQLSENHAYTKIATAHHLNDSVETILLNLARKTGIRGVLGIPVVNNNIIRPLLFASKEIILKYCKDNSLEFRIDKTNYENDFQRNKIRNLIIPEFEKINTAFSQNIIDSSKNISQYYELFKYQMKIFEENCVFYDDYGYEIDVLKLKKFKPVRLFLYEFLSPFGFNSSHIDNILQLGLNSSGKIIESEEYKLVLNRKKLYLNKKSLIHNESFQISFEKNKRIFRENKFDELQIETEIIDSENFSINKSRSIANLDFDKLKFPLTIRKWKNGDFFYPLGMKGKKKISDFFTDKKFSSKEKNETWILEFQGNIIWIINHRIDERFKVTKKTKKIFEIRVLS